MKKLNALMTISLKLVLIYAAFNYYNKGDDRITGIDYNTISEINPDSVIDDYTLLSQDLTKDFTNDILKSIINRGYLIIHPMFGPIPNENFLGKKEVNIMIESGGGSVRLAKHIVNMLLTIKTQGITVNCYTSKAMSMAFHILIVGCDNRIALGDVKLMQHKSYYMSDVKVITPSSMNDDIFMSNIEADILGIDINHWLRLTRSNKNKNFTKKEIKKYKLITRQY